MTARPNIVLIVADDMGYGDFGCFNFGAPQTPTLYQLIGEGICLTQHYSASPVCAPARTPEHFRRSHVSAMMDPAASRNPGTVGPSKTSSVG